MSRVIIENSQARLFLARLCHDWDILPDGLRKATSFKEAVPVHMSCGMFIHFLGILQEKAPAGEFKELEFKLTETFMSGMMDPELRRAAENSVPPGDVKSIGSFRQVTMIATTQWSPAINMEMLFWYMFTDNTDINGIRFK